MPKLKPAQACIFCDIVAGKHAGKTDILFQDMSFSIFRDIQPAAAKHLLVVTNEHISSFKSLQPSKNDRELVSSMVCHGRRLLEQLQPGAQQKFGFHLPPFNGVSHLHLHCMALPHTTWWAPWVYASWAPWWLDAQDALGRLTPASKESKSKTL